MRKTLLFLVPAIIFMPVAGHADTVETVVVTATRTPQPARITGESIDVITSKELETQQIAVVTDALKEVPGVMVNRQGGVGQLTTISLRGAEAGQTVVLLDGVRLNDPSATDDIAILGDILVNNLERIEVLRGPQSTLYGSDAIGGVVNILTRRGGEAPFALTASAEGGSFNTYHLNVAANGSDGALEYGAALNYFGSREVSAADSRNGNTEPDGYKNIGATTNLRIHASDAVSIDLRGYFTNGHAGFDDNFDFTSPLFLVKDSKANNRQEQFAGYAGINVDLFDGISRNRLAVIATTSNRRYFDSAFDSIHLNSDDFSNVLRLEYQGILNPWRDSEITFGAETERSAFRGDSFSSCCAADRSGGHTGISGYYLQAQQTLFEQVTLTSGVRYDEDAGFGAHTSLKFAAAWHVPSLDATLHANYGDGFKAPSLFQQFSEFRPPVTNPPLKPETARGWEIGIAKSLLDDRLSTSLTYFSRRTSNMIDFVNCPGPATGCATRPFGFYDNVGRTQASGLEAEVTARVADDLNLSANYTNLSAVDQTSGRDVSLPRRPHSEANTTLTWTPGPDWTGGASLQYVGGRFDDAAAMNRLPAFALVNLFGSYRVNEQYELFARVTNLFDAHYEPILGYGAEGRGAFAGIRAKL